ncbi:hypothetical protein ACO0R3_003763 [Hanseniaspora guilliermondii]
MSNTKVRPSFKIPPPNFQGIKNHYYCLYCKSSYKGTPKIISNHLSGHSHKQNVKVYYTNKFLQLYDRSKLKKQGKFKLANDINRFENTFLNNKKLGIQFINEVGMDPENGSNIFSKIKLLSSTNSKNNGVPDFILKRRIIQKYKNKNKHNPCKERKITNKDKQQLYEAKKLLKQLNKNNSYKKYLIKKYTRKLLKRLHANTDENLNLNFNFNGNRKIKYNHEVEDNSLQVLNHIYKKSPNFNRIFLNSSENNLNILQIREQYISAFNESLRQRKLRSLKNKIAKVRYRIAVKRKYGKRKFNPKKKPTPNSSNKSNERLYLDKFNKDFSDDNLLKHLKLKLRHLDNVSMNTKLKIRARSNMYKMFKENIHVDKFINKIQSESNRYTNSLLLPPRTLNINNNSLTRTNVNFDDFIVFPKLSMKSKQKMGPIPSWLSTRMSNKLLNRRLMYPKVSDLNDKIPENLLNHFQKSKKLKHLIKQALYKEQRIKSMFKYQAILWRNFKRRNTMYKLTNALVNNKKVINILQSKLLGKHWFNKIYGDREGKGMKLKRLSRYRVLKEKRIKYNKQKKLFSSKNKKIIKVDNEVVKPEIAMENKIKVIKPIKKRVPVIAKPNKGSSVQDKIIVMDPKKVVKPVSRFEGKNTTELRNRFVSHEPTKSVVERALEKTMDKPNHIPRNRFNSRFEGNTYSNTSSYNNRQIRHNGGRYEQTMYTRNNRYEGKRYVNKQSIGNRFEGKRPSRFQG